MSDSGKQALAQPSEVTGVFLDHETGRSQPYVARFRTVASDVLWSARVKLAGRWVPIRGGRLADAGTEPDDFVVSELVRDSVLDSLFGDEMEQVREQDSQRRARSRLAGWLLGAAVLAVLAVLAAGAWYRGS